MSKKKMRLIYTINSSSSLDYSLPRLYGGENVTLLWVYVNKEVYCLVLLLQLGVR